MALFRPGVKTGFAATTERSPVGNFRTSRVTPRPVAPGAALPASGGTPGYSAALAAFPGVLSADNNATFRASDAATARTAQTRAAYLATGGLPPGFKDSYGDLDAATLEAGRQNPYSAYAQTQRAHEQNFIAGNQALAARGQLSSGQLATNLERQSYQQGLDFYNLGNSFGGAVNKAIEGYTGVLGQNREDRSAAILQAQQALSTNPAYAPAWAPPGVARPVKRRFNPAPIPNHHLVERGL